jgi:hypothetical protein
MSDVKRITGVKTPKWQDVARCTDQLDTAEKRACADAWCYLERTQTPEVDYWQYVNYYIKTGRKMLTEYYTGDPTQLEKAYEEYDEGEYKPMSLDDWKANVYYCALKLSGTYSPESHDRFFFAPAKEKPAHRTTPDSREYNPAIICHRPLREQIHMKVRMFDMKSAWPSYITRILGETPLKSPYEAIQEVKKCTRDKAKIIFNSYLNYHIESHKDWNDKQRALPPEQRSPKYPMTDEWARYEECTSVLEKAWPSIRNFFTKEIYRQKGEMYAQLAQIETEEVQNFVRANGLINWIRLHDAIMVPETTEIKVLQINAITWEEKFSKFEKAPEPWHPSNIYSVASALNSGLIFKWLERKGYTIKNTGGAEGNKKSPPEPRLFKKITDCLYKEADLNAVKKEMLESHKLEEYIAKNSEQTSQEYEFAREALKLFCDKDYLTWGNFDVFRDDARTTYIASLQGVVKITPDNIEVVSDKAIVAPDQIYGINLQDPLEAILNRSNFARFLWSLGLGEVVMPETPVILDTENKNLMGLLTHIGLALNADVHEVEKKCVVFTDKGSETGVRKGRRGKSLILESIKKVVWCSTIQLKGNDPEKVFSTVENKQKCAIVDDLMDPSKDTLGMLFESITGVMPRRRLYHEPSPIPQEDKPRILIGSNFILDNVEDSSKARFTECPIPAVFNANFRPDELYKERFLSHDPYRGWSPEQFSDFLRIMAMCAQLYLKHGLVSPEIDKQSDLFRMRFRNQIVLEQWEEAMERTGWTNKTWRFVIDTSSVFYSHLQDIQRNDPVKERIGKNKIRTMMADWCAYRGYQYSEKGKEKKICIVNPEMEPVKGGVIHAI